MTLKQFFNSKVFRCIIVLLCIALISGGLLSILNDLWAVSDEEIINRAIAEICGPDVSLVNDVDLSSGPSAYHSDNPNGKVDNVYVLSSNDLLIKATGNGGYHSGTVSVYVLAKFDGLNFAGIENVSIADYASSQTLMSKFNESTLSYFKDSTNTSETEDFVASGASYSSKAVKNAVNAALEYIEHAYPYTIEEDLS